MVLQRFSRTRETTNDTGFFSLFFNVTAFLPHQSKHKHHHLQDHPRQPTRPPLHTPDSKALWKGALNERPSSLSGLTHQACESQRTEHAQFCWPELTGRGRRVGHFIISSEPLYLCGVGRLSTQAHRQLREETGAPRGHPGGRRRWGVRQLQPGAV